MTDVPQQILVTYRKLLIIAFQAGPHWLPAGSLVSSHPQAGMLAPLGSKNSILAFPSLPGSEVLAFSGHSVRRTLPLFFLHFHGCVHASILVQCYFIRTT